MPGPRRRGRASVPVSGPRLRFPLLFRRRPRHEAVAPVPAATTFPELSYAVHFHGRAPLLIGNAKNLAPPTVTGCTCTVFPSGLVTAMRITDASALPPATPGTPPAQNITFVPRPG